MSSVTSPVALLSAPDIFIVNSMSYAAISFHVCEWFGNLPFEVGHIWRKSPASLIKWQYLISRYAGILVQIVNAIVCTRFESETLVSLSLCQSWHTFQWITSKALILSLNLSLIHRIFALYDRSRVANWLMVLASAEFLIGLLWGFFIPRVVEINKPCVMRSIPGLLIYLVVLHFIVQAIIFVLTLFKYRRSRGVKSAMVTRVSRDACYASAAMLGLYSCMLLNNILLRSKSHINKTILTQTIFVLLPVIATSANCHIIANMERMTPSRYVPMASVPFAMTEDIGEDTSI